MQAIPSRISSNTGALTSLVNFETAPFPYRGTVPDLGQPFLNAETEGHRGHVNFRGNVLWELPTFSDDRVLLHIPPGFDPKRPAVMVVFFHGHGANLAQDVYDRQQVPAQITAAGVNAVLVAPQFAVNAADLAPGNSGNRTASGASWMKRLSSLRECTAIRTVHSPSPGCRS